MSNYIQTLISSPDREEANRISDALVSGKLIAGSLIKEGAARYWWEGEVVEKTYWNIEAFSMADKKNQIIELVESMAQDECPIVAFFDLDGNQKFLNWISDSLKEVE